MSSNKNCKTLITDMYQVPVSYFNLQKQYMSLIKPVCHMVLGKAVTTGMLYIVINFHHHQFFLSKRNLNHFLS